MWAITGNTKYIEYQNGNNSFWFGGGSPTIPAGRVDNEDFVDGSNRISFASWPTTNFSMFRTNCTSSSEVQNQISDLLESTGTTYHTWKSLLCHSVNGQGGGFGSFADFKTAMDYIEDNHGSDGADNCWMVNDQDVVEYLITTSMSIRSYSGGVHLKNCDTSGCTAAIEIVAGQVKLDSTCTSGYIDLCGVGYLVNNSSGSTVKTLGLVGEFPLTSEDVDKLASLTGLTELLVLTGMTEQLNTIESGVTISNENIIIVNDNVIELTNIVTGITEKINVIESGVTMANENIIIVNDNIVELTNIVTGTTPQVIAESVWNFIVTGTTVPGSSYDILTSMSDEVKRILGLTQENFRITDQIYDTRDLLQSATIKIYNNSSDCNGDVNPLAEYDMTALYDGNGRLTDYKVIKV